MTQPYIAEIAVFGFNFPPRGWCFCDGRILAIQQFTAVFSIVGTYYGGNGTTTFAVPNFQGNAAMNVGTGQGLSSYVIGETSGVASVTLTQSEMPQHNHTAYTSAGSTLDLAPTANGWLGERTPGHQLFTTNTPDTSLNPLFLQPAGGSQGHVNQQPYLALNFCFALEGIYPQRN